ncbi:hypothetical protein RIN61_21370 [Pseudomonas inefficax]|nr:hypothetical protein [Pseudomonas inefficax]WNN38718.1 hypothetical protein RIN61_21370 [Pseudomonas inefficax]
MCREGLQRSPGDACAYFKILGLLRSPIATQGRSYKACVSCIAGG